MVLVEGLTLVAAGAVLLLSLACASGLPAVVSATPDEVAVEFEKDGTVSTTRELADQQCMGFGKIAQFDTVNTEPNSRVAKFRCVPPEGQVAADAKAEAEAAKLAADAEMREQAAAARAAAEALAEAQAAQAAAQRAAETPPVSAAPAAEAAGDVTSDSAESAADTAAEAATP
jgi:hypothetical protein